MTENPKINDKTPNHRLRDLREPKQDKHPKIQTKLQKIKEKEKILKEAKFRECGNVGMNVTSDLASECPTPE